MPEVVQPPMKRRGVGMLDMLLSLATMGCVVAIVLRLHTLEQRVVDLEQRRAPKPPIPSPVTPPPMPAPSYDELEDEPLDDIEEVEPVRDTKKKPKAPEAKPASGKNVKFKEVQDVEEEDEDEESPP